MCDMESARSWPTPFFCDGVCVTTCLTPWFICGPLVITTTSSCFWHCYCYCSLLLPVAWYLLHDAFCLSFLPAACHNCLLPLAPTSTAYCIIPIAPCLLQVLCGLFPFASCALHGDYYVIPWWLLPTVPCLSQTAYCLFPVACCLPAWVPTASCLSHTMYCLLVMASCILKIASCPLSLASCLLPL